MNKNFIFIDKIHARNLVGFVIYNNNFLVRSMLSKYQCSFLAKKVRRKWWGYRYPGLARRTYLHPQESRKTLGLLNIKLRSILILKIYSNSMFSHPRWCEFHIDIFYLLLFTYLAKKNTFINIWKLWPVKRESRNSATHTKSPWESKKKKRQCV